MLVWGLLSGFYIKELSSTPTLFWFHDAFGWIVLPVGCLAVLWVRYNVKPTDYGLPSLRPQEPSVSEFIKLGLSLLIFLSFIPIEAIALLVAPPEETAFSYAEALPKGAMGKLLALYLAISAAFVEEIFYRGLLREVFLGKHDSIERRILFVVVSAALFGLNHWSQGSFKMIATTYLGIAAALLYLRYRNLWYLIAGHLALNLVIG